MRNHKQRKNIFNRPARLAGATLLAGAALLGTTQKSEATPATLGFYPATDIYGPGTFHLDVDSYRADGFRSTNAFDSAGITYGFGDGDGAFGRTEIGFDYLSDNNASLGDSLLFNVKTQLYNNDEAGTRVVGGLWLAGTRQSGASNVGYIAGSKSFSFGRITAGVAHAFRNMPTGSDDTFLQLGFDRPITNKVLFAADFYSGRSAISGIQPTLYYSVNDSASFGIGYFFNREPAGGGNNDQLYLCFDYNFGGRNTAPPAEGEPGAPGM